MLTGTTILFADDDPLIRSVIRIVLSEAAARVIACQDGVEAVERFAESMADINAVVLDYTMPGLTGLEAFEQMRQMKGALRGVIIAGTLPSPELSAAIAAGQIVFVSKPFRGPELLAALEQVLKPVSAL